MEITKYLENSEIVKSYKILNLKTFEIGFYIKIAIELINENKLFFKEYVDEKERNYSYHWQDNQKKLIKRWDNAPHHKHIKTYPHHYHYKNNVFESYDISIKDILMYIEKNILK